MHGPFESLVSVPGLPEHPQSFGAPPSAVETGHEPPSPPGAPSPIPLSGGVVPSMPSFASAPPSLPPPPSLPGGEGDDEFELHDPNAMRQTASAARMSQEWVFTMREC